MRRLFRLLARLLLIGLLLAATSAAFWFGIVPQRFSPLAPIALDAPQQWFIDLKLAALRRDPALCHAVLKTPQIDTTQVDDIPINKGCGLINGVRTSAIAGARLSADRMSCELAAALALWMAHDVQPLAMATFGKPVQGVQHLGTYACRNIVGRAFWKDFRSQHATANAIDIGGFTLEGGRQISVLKHWSGDGVEARFLRDVHARACGYFRVVLGPEFNASHRDHFHFDRGDLKTCR